MAEKLLVAHEGPKHKSSIFFIQSDTEAKNTSSLETQGGVGIFLFDVVIPSLELSVLLGLRGEEQYIMLAPCTELLCKLIPANINIWIY